MSDQNFYRAFEDRYRGSRELIKSRLQIYRPFIEPLISSEDSSHAIDLGCGRGEWLEILREMGISAVGVDLDEGMLAACSERGLKVVLGDAIAHLSSLEDNSQLVVSAFHMVEHISFDQLRNLVQEAHRVLKPGGLLIMETPNPENIMVATSSFYLDPTHVRPIPPDLLLFITEFYNFFRSKVVRLQEWSEITKLTSLNLNHVLGGASPDYAVIAQKRAKFDVLSKCDDAFATEYGVDTKTLAEKYSDQQNKKFQEIQSSLAKAEQAEKALISIYSSFSWRVTRPIRWLGKQRRKLKEEGIKARLRVVTKKIYFRTLGRITFFKDPESPFRKSLYWIRDGLGYYPSKASNMDSACIANGLSIGAQKIYFKLNKANNNAHSD